MASLFACISKTPNVVAAMALIIRLYLIFRFLKYINDVSPVATAKNVLESATKAYHICPLTILLINAHTITDINIKATHTMVNIFHSLVAVYIFFGYILTYDASK